MLQDAQQLADRLRNFAIEVDEFRAKHAAGKEMLAFDLYMAECKLKAAARALESTFVQAAPC